MLVPGFRTAKPLPKKIPGIERCHLAWDLGQGRYGSIRNRLWGIPGYGYKALFPGDKGLWKSGWGDTLVIATAVSSAACGVEYPLGAEVIVFAENNTGDCWAPGGMLVTYLWSYNVHQPTQAQLDTLYGVTASIAAGGTGNRRAQISGGKGILRDGNRMIFQVQGSSSSSTFGTDGRAFGSNDMIGPGSRR